MSPGSPEDLIPFCERRRQLAEAFTTAARLYSEAAVSLAVSGASQTDHLRLCRLAVEAQNRSMAALAEYQEHVDSHRCHGSSKVESIAGLRRGA
jgi:hypothetical protein